MNINFLLLVSLIAVIIHLYQESKSVSKWSEGRFMYRNSATIQQKSVLIACLGIGITYAAVVLFEILIGNDLSKIFIVGSQGAIFFNFIVHFIFKFVWKLKMPAFMSSVIFGLIPCLIISFSVYNAWWFSGIFFAQIFTLGMIVDLLLIILLNSFSSFFTTTEIKTKTNDWEDF